MMRNLWLYLVIVLSCMTAATAATAQTADDQWVRLGVMAVKAGSLSNKADLTQAQGRSKAVRLVAIGSRMTVARVVVTYANGQVYFEDRPPEFLMKLNRGDRSKPIDPREDEERFVDAVEVGFAEGGAPSTNAKLEVWGLQSPTGAKANRSGVAVTDAPSSPGDVIATKLLSLSVDRDVVTFAADRPGTGTMSIRAVDRPVTIVGIEVVDTAGAATTLAFSGDISVGAMSRPIPVGVASFRQIRIAYRPDPAAGGVATIEIYAKTTVPGEKGVDDEEVGYVQVPVFFGTDREREQDRLKNGRALASFAGKGSTDLKLGRSIVTVPTSKDRDQGAITRPDWNLVLFSVAFRDEDPARDFTIQSVDVLSENEFATAVKERMGSAVSFKGQAFVFVHGYNVGFDDAIFRTAQISHDIGFDSAAFLFSWPSSASFWGYNHDQKRVLGARDDFRRYLEIVRRESGAKKIHLIAHSMGNVLLMETMRDMADAPRVAGSTAFNEIILAAPDVTRDNFAKIAKLITPLASGLTLYASSRDRALRFSADIALGETPAGAVPSDGPLIVKGIDTIDISAISTDFFNLNHSEFADRKVLLGDMETLLKAATHPPEARLGAFVKTTIPAGIYWKYTTP
jgi:esterase/lipase superfamily enzyme